MNTTVSEKKSVKTLKGQLFGALSMMLVASIALGTSTYAWFINNNTVAVDPMQLTVSASTSMTVAVGKKLSFTAPTTTANWTPYKTLITNEDITGLAADGSPSTRTDVADWAKMFVNPLTPASIASANLSVPSFFMSNGHILDSKLDEFTALTKDVGDSNAGQGPVKIIPLRFLSATEMNVFFGRAANGTAGDSGYLAALTDIAQLIVPKKSVLADETQKAAEQAKFDAQAAAIRQALKIAVVPHTDANYAAGDVPPIVFQFDNGTTHIVGAGNNTKYLGTAPVTLANETAGIYAAIASLGATAGTGGGFPVATDTALNAKISGTTAGTSHDYIAAVAAGSGNIPGEVTAGVTPLFTLKENLPLDVDVYIWLEGTDMDCLSTLSEYGFHLDLPFAAAKPTT